MIRKSLFPVVLDEFMNNGLMSHNATTAPAVNVQESDTDYTMEVAAPGITKEQCHVDITNEGLLSVAIERKTESKNEEEGNKTRYLRREFAYSNYRQRYNLPEEVERESITARVENGVLTIVMPKVKKEEVKLSRQIEVA